MACRRLTTAEKKARHRVFKAQGLSYAERARRYRQCTGKIIYDTMEEANAVAERLFQEDGEYMQGYVCPICAGIHTGHIFPSYLRTPPTTKTTTKEEPCKP